MIRRTVRAVLAGAVVSALALPVAAVLTAAPAFAVDPVAGGLSASPPDSLFPNQGNSGYDVSHYDIAFRVDIGIAAVNNGASTTTLSDSTTTIQASTTGAPLSSFSLDFQGTTSTLAASTFNVDAVTVNGQPATFTRVETTTTSNATTDKHKLVITPAAPVDGAFTTVVTTSGRPVIHTDTDSSLEGWNNTVDGATFVNQPVGAMTLFPHNNTPRDKATYTWTVDAPTVSGTSNFAQAGGKPYQVGVVSNGELVSRTPSGDGTRTTWVWDQAKPQASELALFSVGRYDIYTSNITLASGRTIPEWTFIDPAISVANQTTTLSSRAQLKAVLDFFESKYGPYPGNSVGLVTDNTTGINYALETQDRPYAPNSYGRGTMYHEIMHQWWGDGVAPTDWNDITLNEGPAQYSEFQFPYEGAGSSTTTTEQANYNLWNTAGAGVFTTPPAAMTQASQLFGSQVYQRGSMSLEALRTSIGAAAFETLMRTYQATYGGGQITGRRTAAFQALAESISGRDLTAFFQTWWFTSGKPAWPVKFTFNLAGPAAPVEDGAADFTLTARNTGKVAMPAAGTTIALDVADVLDDATLGTLPAGVTLSGTTLSWAVPATALAATSSVTIPFTANAGTTGNLLKGVAAAATLGGTCLDCTASAVVGNAAISPAPVPTVTPGGAPVVGVALTADTSGWAAGTSLALQWLVDGTPVAGATGPTYTPGAGEVGSPVTVKVTGTLAGANPVIRTSAIAGATVRGTQQAGTLPTISGTPKIGSPLTVDPGTWEPGTVFTYAWRANGVTISGATGPTYTPAVATQVGQTLDVVVTGTKAGWTTLAKTSAATAAVAAGDPLTLTPTPVLTGTPKVGVSYLASPGVWDDRVVLTYQWAANGLNIAGATAVAFTPTAAQLGLPLTVTVTGTRPGIPAVSRPSAASAPVDPGTQTLQPTPSITGTPRALVASTGVPGTWDTGTTLTHQWYADGVAIPGATTTTLTPALGLIGQVLTYEVTSTRAGYTTVVKSSPGKTVLGLLQVLQPTPTISGTAQVGATLTGAPDLWDLGTIQTYQWLADGAPIAGATGLTHDVAVAELGTKLTFAVTSTLLTFEPVTKTSAPTATVAAGDLSSTPTPTISGTPQVGVALTAVPGAWDSGVTLTYQWGVGGADVPGATDPAYTPVGADAGQTVTVTVTGTKTGYASVSKQSGPTAAVADGVQVATPKPTVSGTPKVGVELTAVPGSWDAGVSLAYQWTVDGTDVPGATDLTYTPVAADAGEVVTVAVTGTRAGWTTVTKQSDPTGPVANGTQGSTPTPTISGTPKVAVPLTAVPGSWDGGTVLTYQWTVDGTEVASATGSSYTPVAADLGLAVTVKVTGTRAGFDAVTKESDPTAAVAAGTLTTTPNPTFSGTSPQVGVTFTALPGAWDAGVTFTFQWTADGSAIPGATGATYAVAAGDLGTAIAVQVTGSKPGYTSVTRTSGSSSPIQAGDLTSTPKPTVTGAPQVAGTLTAVPGTWDSGVTLGYQWTVAGADVSGATAPTYSPVASDATKVVTVKVTGTKPGYMSVTKESDPTGPVTIGTLTLTPTPTVSGSAVVGQALTATAGTWDSGVTLAYQWTSGGTDLTGATASTYTPVAGDVGKVLTVKVTGSKTGFASVMTQSAPTAEIARADLALTPVPTVGGVPQFGELLVAGTGAWDTGTTFTYQWLVDSVAVDGATTGDYLLRAGDVGRSVAVAVTGSKPGYNAVTRTSTGTSPVTAATLRADQCTVSLKGKAKVGRKLRAHVDGCPAGATVRYAWYAGAQQITGADAATYTLRKRQAGKKIKVLVSVSLPGYAAVLRSSDPTGKVKK